MAIRRVRLQYDVYPPGYKYGDTFYFDLRTFSQAIRRARGFGAGATIWRSVQQTNKSDAPLGDWWDIRLFLWTGATLKKIQEADWDKYCRKVQVLSAR